MYNTSQNYKDTIYSKKNLLLNIYINGVLIGDDDIFGFRVSHNLFDGDTVKLGSVTSKLIELEINSEALPEDYSNIYVETGITINGEDEIVPIGHFTLEEINQDDNVVTITAVDYMMRFEKMLSTAVSGTAYNILQAICNACSVELGSSTFLGYNEEITVNNTDLTVRQIIGRIAEKAGGFAVIGRDGKLYIKTIGTDTSSIDIELFNDYKWGKKFTCNQVNLINDNYHYEVTDTDYSSAELEVELDALLYSNTVDGQVLKLSSDNSLIATEQQVYNIYNVVKNLTLYSFEGQSIIDPALDIGDIVYIDNKPVIIQGDMEYLGYFKGNITSKIETEEKSKTTVQKISLPEELRKKVNIEEIIETINEKGEETEQTINPSILNINGIESINGNFSVDEQGNMYCQNATIDGAAIVNGENFSVDEQGNIKAKTGEIAGWNIDENGLSKNDIFIHNNGFASIYTVADYFVVKNYLQGTPGFEFGPVEIEHYDLNNDGVVNSGDLYILRRMTLGY